MLQVQGEFSHLRSHRDIPFGHFAARLPPNPTPSHIHHVYKNLYESCAAAVRRKEGEMVRRDDGSEIDMVSSNGTMLGGTLLLKNEEAWRILGTDSKRLAMVLEAVGIPASRAKLTSHISL